MIMETDLSLPSGLKAAGIYLVVIGALGFAWPFLGLGPHHEDFIIQSDAYKIEAYSIAMVFNLMFLVSGLGILSKKNWGSQSAVIVLIVSTIYIAKSFAWGFIGSRPTTYQFLGFLSLIALWNGLWILLIYKRKKV